MTDVNLGQLAASTLRNRPNEVSDSVTANNALLAWYKKNRKFESYSGGRTFLLPINYAEAGAVKWYDGAQEGFAITPESVLDSSEWARKFWAGFVYFTEAEKQANKGQAAAVRLVENKITVLKATAANAFSTAMYNDGTTSNEIVGLQAQIADNPTTGTLGGIDASTYTWWRNKYTVASTDDTTIRSKLVALWLSTIRGTDKPDLLVAGTERFTNYFDSLSDLQRFTTSDTADVLNFEGLKFQSAMMLHDPNCNTERVYGIDTSDIVVGYDSGCNFALGDSRQVTNAFYEVQPVKWSGFVGIKRRESHFVLNGA